MRSMMVLAGAFLAITVSQAQAQVELKSYVDAEGFIDIQKLTCAQLADTFQEDADMLTTWYSGWYNGLAKKHFLHLTRGKELEHEVIVYCKANRDKKIIQAIDVMLKSEKAKAAFK